MLLSAELESLVKREVEVQDSSGEALPARVWEEEVIRAAVAASLDRPVGLAPVSDELDIPAPRSMLSGRRRVPLSDGPAFQSTRGF